MRDALKLASADVAEGENPGGSAEAPDLGVFDRSAALRGGINLQRECVQIKFCGNALREAGIWGSEANRPEETDHPLGGLKR